MTIIEGPSFFPGYPARSTLFTYRAFDLVTTSPLDSLPYVGVSFGEVLNDVGPFQGNLPLTDPRVQALDWADATRTGRTALFVDLDGALVWGGIIETQRYQEAAAGKPLVIGASTFQSYFLQRLQAADYTVPNAASAYWNASPADPMLVAEQIIMNAQSTAVTFVSVQQTSAPSGTGIVTSLSVTGPTGTGGLTVAIPSGTMFTIAGDPNSPVIVFTTTAAAAIGATTLAVSLGTQSVTTTIPPGNILIGNAPIGLGAIGGNGLNGTQLGIAVIVNGATPQGNWVTTAYPATQLQTIDSIVQTLSQMGYTAGFDYSFDVAYLPGTKIPAITLNFWYPRKGMLAQQSGIVLTKSQLIDFTYPVDSTTQSPGIAETASGTGGLTTAVVSAPSVVAAGYPPLEQVISRTNINNADTLEGCAVGDLDLYANPVVTPTVTVPLALPQPGGGTDPTQIGFADFSIGDDLILRFDPIASGTGLNASPRFPNGLNFEFRITQWLCTVPDAGLPTLKFTLGLPPSNVNPPVGAPLS